MMRIYKKQVVLALAACLLTPPNVRADQAHDPAHDPSYDPVAAHQYVNNVHNIGIIDIGTGDALTDAAIAKAQTNHARVWVGEFMKGFSQGPLAALQYFVEAVNKGETMNKNSTMRLQLEIVDSLPDGALSSLDPVLSLDGNLTLKMTLKRSAANNAAFILEELARLNQMMNREGLMLNVFEEQKGVYLDKPWSKDKHGNYIQHPDHYKHVHWKRHVFHKALQFMGIRTVPSSNVRTPMTWAELKLNASSGSRLAAREMAEIEILNSRSARDSGKSFILFKQMNDPEKMKASVLELAKIRGLALDSNRSPDEIWSDYSEQRLTQLQRDLDSKTIAAQRELKDYKQRIDDPEAKARKDQLEKMPAKLDDLVKANDREGVAKLLEAFLPLDIMEPVEKQFWSQWLESIRHPNFENSVVLFRGIDNQDHPLQTIDPKTKEAAYGFFSVLLTRNQGNYTRRLRSYSTMRYRFANSTAKDTSPLVSTPKLTDIMLNHASNPQGSPFMSFTLDPNVAYSFSGYQGGGLAFVRMDKRRVLANVISGYKNEIEMLVPLIVFPDEVFHYEVFEKDPNFKKPTLEAILEKASAKLGQPITRAMTTTPAQAYAEAYKSFGVVQSELRSGSLCRSLFKR